jgi:DNA-binding transcriptional LysR family regulator
VGRVRLVVSPLAATMVLAPKLGAFARAYPDVVIDVTTTNEMRLDLVAGHFDAGIHLGEFIERDMIAVRVSADQRAAIVGAPEYFNAHPKPKSPHDLTNHRCLNFRHGANETYRWEFDKGKQSLAVAVDGPLVVDDVHLLIRAAIDGVGLTFLWRSTPRHISRTGSWCACSKTGASRSPATSCTTPADGNSPRRCRR